MSRRPAWRVTGLWLAGLACAISLGAGAGAVAATAQEFASERSRISAERQAADAQYRTAQADCQGRFLLTPCLDAARELHRQALDRLRRAQWAVDDQARRQRTAERRERLQDAVPSAVPAASAASGGPGGASAAAVAAPAAERPPPLLRRARSPGPSASQALRNQAAHEQRQREAQAHKAAVTERNARQDARQPPAAGLPLPLPPVLASAPGR